MSPGRVLVTGWPSFLHGEATAGDVLAMEAVRDEITRAGVACDLAWSPVLRPGALALEEADPARYTHLVFACGPLQGQDILALHRRFSQCRRVAVGVSVLGPGDPAAAGFHVILPRDGYGTPPMGDLSIETGQQAGQEPAPETVPVAGVIYVGQQEEYSGRGRHEAVAATLARWLSGCGCALVPLDTRLDPRDWRMCRVPAELEAIIGRLDLVITMRMHGLVLALKHGVPALAVDPVAGGAKVTAQAQAWQWPAVVTIGPDESAEDSLDPARLDEWRDWCLSPAGRDAAGRAAQAPPPSPLGGLLPALGLATPAAPPPGFQRATGGSGPYVAK
jgi:hypothetical protein